LASFAPNTPAEPAVASPPPAQKLFVYASAGGGSLPHPRLLPKEPEEATLPLYRDAEVVSGPEVDEDHPEEMSYVPFEIAGLMTDASVAFSHTVAPLTHPEELRPWRRDEMQYLTIVSGAIRKNDTQARPVFLYNTNHRDANSLVPIAKQVDILAKGCYVNLPGHKRDRAWVRWSVEQEIEAIRTGGRPGAIPLVMPELCKDPEPEEETFTSYTPASASGGQTTERSRLPSPRGASSVAIRPKVTVHPAGPLVWRYSVSLPLPRFLRPTR
jgi:hypothetical protein